jgi:signal transduction histidine kinase
MPSVRRRLTFLLATGFVALTAVAGLWVDRAVAAHATGELDAALATKARAFAALTENERGRIELDYTPTTMPEYEREDRPEYFQFWLDDGTVLLRSRRLAPAHDLPRASAQAASPAFLDARLPDRRAGRVAVLAFTPHAAAPGEGTPDAPDGETIGEAPAVRGVVVAVARDREALDAMLASIRTTLLGVGIAVVLVGVLLLWWALAAGFRPIDEIAAEVGRLDAGRPGQRVEARGAPREVAPVVAQLNSLLARLDEAMGRERRFTGNVAHELRTPIAELRSIAAVGTRWPGDEAAVEQFFRDVDVVAGRMEGLVADLLLLARCQGGAEPAERRPVALREAVETAWAGESTRAQGRDVPFTLDVPEGLRIEADPGKLEIVLRNLLSNAAVHGTPGSEVRCVARRRGGRVRLEISNEAEPLSAADLSRLTDPFWRKDAARASDAHAGLGLAIAAALTSLLRIDLAFEQAPGGTFTVRLEGDAPAADSAPGGAPDPADRATLPLSRS